MGDGTFDQYVTIFLKTGVSVYLVNHGDFWENKRRINLT